MKTLVIHAFLTLLLVSCVNSPSNRNEIFNIYRTTINFDGKNTGITLIKIDTNLHHYWVDLVIYNFHGEFSYSENVNNIQSVNPTKYFSISEDKRYFIVDLYGYHLKYWRGTDYILSATINRAYLNNQEEAL